MMMTSREMWGEGGSRRGGGGGGDGVEQSSLLAP